MCAYNATGAWLACYDWPVCHLSALHAMPRVHNALTRAGFRTLVEVRAALDDGSARDVRSLGRKGLDQLRAVLCAEHARTSSSSWEDIDRSLARCG